MKLVYILPVLLVLIVGGSQAYAESLEFEVNADHKLVDIMGYGTPESQVYLTIWDANNNVVIDEKYRPTDKDEGLFRYQLTINNFPGFGDYTGQLTHEGETHDFEFSFVEKVDSTNPNDLPSQHDQDIERLQAQVREQIEINGQLRDRIIELERELDPGTNSELKEENLELKLENRELKNTIENLQEIINEQIKVILKYFS